MSELMMPCLAAVLYDRGYDIDRLLVDACAELARDGLKLGGLLQITTGERGGSCATSVHVVDLKTNAAFDIWQDRGPCARGCRLDEGGLADAEQILRAAISDRVDLLVINRFGRAESLGRGLRGCFDDALAAGIPIMTVVRAPYDAAWREFHGGMGTELDCSVENAVRWGKLSRRVHRRRSQQAWSGA